jgi:hypothetical protein
MGLVYSPMIEEPSQAHPLLLSAGQDILEIEQAKTTISAGQRSAARVFLVEENQIDLGVGGGGR